MYYSLFGSAYNKGHSNRTGAYSKSTSVKDVINVK